MSDFCFHQIKWGTQQLIINFRGDKLHFNYSLQHVVVHFVITELTEFHNLTIMERSDEGDSTQPSWSDVNCYKWPLFISAESRAELKSVPPAYFSHHQKPQLQHEHKVHLQCLRCISVQLSERLSAKGQITPSQQTQEEYTARVQSALTNQKKRKWAGQQSAMLSGCTSQLMFCKKHQQWGLLHHPPLSMFTLHLNGAYFTPC